MVCSLRYELSSLCSRVSIVLARFTHTLVKLKPLQRNVAQQVSLTTSTAESKADVPCAQLLLDIREIKRTLLELPRYSLAEEGSTAAAAS